MTPRRRGTLTAEERRLWAEVARSVRPLPGRPRLPDPAPPAPPKEPPAPTPTRAVPAPKRSRPAPPALPPLAPMERRTVRALARGRTTADAVLDLHGLTQAAAHARLLGFLRRAQAEGHGLVTVITGRGGGPADAPAGGAGLGERGVLRRVVPHWLRLPDVRPLVIGFEEAGPRQGGSGALYVRLRRARRP